MSSTQTRSITKASDVANQIRNQIVSDGLTEGELFLTVDQVAQRYEVSRTVAREAVSQLRALGVLKGRQCKGLLVAKPDPFDLMARCLPFCGQGRDELAQLGQFRYVLEIGAIELAVAGATPSSIDRLKDLANQYEKLIQQGDRMLEANEVEVQFHTLLLEMSGNPWVSRMHHVVADFFRTAAEHIPGWLTQKSNEAQPTWHHRAIADAVERRDVEQARAILRMHLQELSPQRHEDIEEVD